MFKDTLCKTKQTSPINAHKHILAYSGDAQFTAFQEIANK